MLNTSADLSIPTSWVDWAIGGISLFIGDSTITSASVLTTKLASEKGNADITGSNYRSAIGIKSGKIVLAVIDQATPFEVRGIMSSLGCYDGVMLDGSTASKMRYKNANGTVGTVSFGSRPTVSTVTITNATWL
ncbi:phosphodiester glycosidase family protein [Gorillibacterium timonense]|uniref:phosphodiester glycosidase family protein n=1 Tax=Gorillibacterium timonense TaxID=1689269 RepID=UPI0009E6D11B